MTHKQHKRNIESFQKKVDKLILEATTRYGEVLGAVGPYSDWEEDWRQIAIAFSAAKQSSTELLISECQKWISE